MGLLGEFLVILNLSFVKTEDRDPIMEILRELSRSSRFSLALSFLGKDERKAVRVLWRVPPSNPPTLGVS